MPAVNNGVGTTGFVLGLLALLFAWIPIIGVIGWPLSILGAILSGVGIHQVSAGRADNRGLAVSGAVMSGIALLICILWAAVFGSAVSSAASTAGSHEDVSPAYPAVRQTNPSRVVPQPQDTVDKGQAFPGKKQSDTAVTAGGTVIFDRLAVTSTALRPGDAMFHRTLCTTVSYRNDGAQTARFGTFDFTMQDAKGAIVNPTFFGGGDFLGSGDLAPGGTVRGDVCFEDKAHAKGTYVVLYEPSFFSSDRGAFVNQR